MIFGQVTRYCYNEYAKIDKSLHLLIIACNCNKTNGGSTKFFFLFNNIHNDADCGAVSHNTAAATTATTSDTTTASTTTLPPDSVFFLSMFQCFNFVCESIALIFSRCAFCCCCYWWTGLKFCASTGFIEYSVMACMI